MEIAISTASLNPLTPAALARAQSLGFRQVEINLQPEELGYDYKRKTNARFYRGLARTLAEQKLSVWSTSTPPLTQRWIRLTFWRPWASALIAVIRYCPPWLVSKLQLASPS